MLVKSGLFGLCTIPVPYLYVKSLQLIWRSGTRRFYPGVQRGGINFTIMRECQDSGSSNGRPVTCTITARNSSRNHENHWRKNDLMNSTFFEMAAKFTTMLKYVYFDELTSDLDVWMGIVTMGHVDLAAMAGTTKEIPYHTHWDKLTHWSLGMIFWINNFQLIILIGGEIATWTLLMISQHSGNGLASSGDNPLPEPVLTHVYLTIWRHQDSMI